MIAGNEEEHIRCTLRGKFKKDFHLKKDKQYLTDIAVVGDYVEFSLNEDGTGVITGIDKRENYISRKAPRIKGAGFHGERLEQVIAANIDNLIVVSSIQEPAFNNKTVDRLLVAGESAKVIVYLIINKSDLDNNNEISEWKSLYEQSGYKVFVTSAITGAGTGDLKKLLSGNTSLFFGQSGVGKSSLLNAMYPGLDLKTGEISRFTEKGTHTTVTSVMIKTAENTFVIDTPGIREIIPYGLTKQDLGHYFIEFLNYINDCKFNTCTHLHEPGCAIIDAVNKGNISPYRYNSYLRMLETIEEDNLY